MQYFSRVLLTTLYLFDQYAINHRKNNTPLELLRILLIMILWLVMSPFLLLFLPIKFIFYKTCNLISISGTRLHTGQIQMAEDHYLHPETGKKIILVGMLHCAENRFYQNIFENTQNYQRQGFSVLTEGITPLTKTQYKKSSKKVKTFANQLMAHVAENSHLEMIFELKSQDQGLKGLRSTNNDMDIGYIVKLFKFNNITMHHFSPIDRESFYQSMENSFGADEEEIVLRQINKLLGDWALFEILINFSKHSRAYKNVIIQLRNHHAVEQILKVAVNHDVLSLWGAGHLAGMGSLLKDQGFKKVKRKWNVALDVSTLKLSPALKEYLNRNEVYEFVNIFASHIMATSMSRNK